MKTSELPSAARRRFPRLYVRRAGKEEGDCEELKHVPQGLDTTLLEITGEKAVAIQTRGTVSVISLLPTGAIGTAFTTPGQHPAAHSDPKYDWETCSSQAVSLQTF